MRKIKDEDLPSEEDIVRYFIKENLARAETLRKLNISIHTFYLALKKYKIKKSQKQINACRDNENLKKYGKKNVFQLETTKQAIRNTCERKTGKTHHLKTKDSLEKQKRTNSERYGVEHIFQDTKKIQKAFSDKYGVINASQLPETQVKVRKTTSDRYGYEHILQSPVFKERIKKINLDTHGYEYASQSPEIKKKKKGTFDRKYGGMLKGSPILREQIEHTMMSEHGTIHPLQSPKILAKAQTTTKRNLGVENAMQSPIIVTKARATAKANGTTNTSKAEIKILEWLRETYNTVIHEYQSEQYSKDKQQYSCDFFIISTQLYIEYQGRTFGHGKRPFDPNNLVHINEVERLKQIVIERKKSKNKDQYASALRIWTETDTLKRDVAERNNLNYLELWPLDYKKGKDWLLWIVSKGQLPLDYAKKELDVELYSFKDKDGSFFNLNKHNKIVLHYQPHFYRKERRLWNDPYIRQELIKNREEHLLKGKRDYTTLTNAELLRRFRIGGFNKNAYSHFNPLLVKAFIQKYNITSIYDPCAGWGHRLLGAASANVPYLGIDACKETVEGSNRIIQDFNLVNCEVRYGLAEEIIPDKKYDAVFTCPPYFDQEKYIGEQTSTALYPTYQDWLNVWWKKVVENALQTKPRYFAFVMSGQYADDMVKVCEDCSLTIVEKLELKKNKSHFAKKSKKSESLIVLN